MNNSFVLIPLQMCPLGLQFALGLPVFLLSADSTCMAVWQFCQSQDHDCSKAKLCYSCCHGLPSLQLRGTLCGLESVTIQS